MKSKIFVFVFLAVSILSISGCAKIETVDLSKYKTEYVGDNSKVIQIVSNQKYPKGYSYDSIEIQSQTKPYGLTVYLKGDSSTLKLENELQDNANTTFELIGNLGTLDYKLKDNKELLGSYVRK